MWESTEIKPSNFWREVPSEVKPYYHWYNTLAVTAKNIENPLQMIKLLVKQEDFLLLKIDIDNSAVEEEFISQILADPSLIALIDDLYFEHHVNVPEMNGYWGVSPNFLNSTYQLFRKMREGGISAHSWV